MPSYISMCDTMLETIDEFDLLVEDLLSRDPSIEEMLLVAKEKLNYGRRILLRDRKRMQRVAKVYKLKDEDDDNSE